MHAGGANVFSFFVRDILKKSFPSDESIDRTNEQALVTAVEAHYPRIKIDVEGQLAYYREVRPLLLPLIADTIDYTNVAFDAGKKVLVEGACVRAETRLLDSLLARLRRLIG